MKKRKCQDTCHCSDDHIMRVYSDTSGGDREFVVPVIDWESHCFWIDAWNDHILYQTQDGAKVHITWRCFKESTAAPTGPTEYWWDQTLGYIDPSKSALFTYIWAVNAGNSDRGMIPYGVIYDPSIETDPNPLAFYSFFDIETAELDDITVRVPYKIPSYTLSIPSPWLIAVDHVNSKIYTVEQEYNPGTFGTATADTVWLRCLDASYPPSLLWEVELISLYPDMSGVFQVELVDSTRVAILWNEITENSDPEMGTVPTIYTPQVWTFNAGDGVLIDQVTVADLVTDEIDTDEFTIIVQNIPGHVMAGGYGRLFLKVQLVRRATTFGDLAEILPLIVVVALDSSLGKLWLYQSVPVLNPQWSLSPIWGYYGTAAVNGHVADPDGGVIFAYPARGPTGDEWGFWKLDADGVFVWGKTWTCFQIPTVLNIDEDGRLYVGGVSNHHLTDEFEGPCKDVCSECGSIETGFYWWEFTTNLIADFYTSVDNECALACNTEDLYGGTQYLAPIEAVEEDAICQWGRCGELAGDCADCEDKRYSILLAVLGPTDGDGNPIPKSKRMRLRFYKGDGSILGELRAPLDQVCGPAVFQPEVDNTTNEVFNAPITTTRITKPNQCDPDFRQTECCPNALLTSIPVKRKGLFPGTGTLIRTEDGLPGGGAGWMGTITGACETTIALKCDLTDTPGIWDWYISINGDVFRRLDGATGQCVPFSFTTSLWPFLSNAGSEINYILACTYLVIGDDDGSIEDVSGLDVTMTFTPDNPAIPPYVLTRTVTPDGCNSFGDTFTSSSPCGTKTISFGVTLSATNTIDLVVVVDGTTIFTGHNTFGCEPFSASFGSAAATFCGASGSVTAAIAETA